MRLCRHTFRTSPLTVWTLSRPALVRQRGGHSTHLRTIKLGVHAWASHLGTSSPHRLPKHTAVTVSSRLRLICSARLCCLPGRPSNSLLTICCAVCTTHAISHRRDFMHSKRRNHSFTCCVFVSFPPVATILHLQLTSFFSLFP